MNETPRRSPEGCDLDDSVRVSPALADFRVHCEFIECELVKACRIPPRIVFVSASNVDYFRQLMRGE